VAVLKVNFKKYGNGTEKIERGEFVIQDAITKRDIDLNTDWEVCFSPGQRVMMNEYDSHSSFRLEFCLSKVPCMETRRK
jgi:hypothetical protein